MAPAVFNLVWILAMLTVGAAKLNEPMQKMAWAIVIASFLQWMTTQRMTSQISRSKKYFSEEKDSQDTQLKLTQQVGQIFIAVLATAGSQINSFVDSIFSQAAAINGPAILWYAIRIQQLPIALFGLAVAAAVVPKMTTAMKKSNLILAEDIFNNGVKMTLWLLIPSSLLILQNSEAILKFIYGYGGFDYSAIDQTSKALVGYSLAIIPTALNVLLAAILFAQNNFKTPAKIALFFTVLNAFLNYFFIYALTLGVVSVTIATTICAWLNTAWLIQQTHRTLTLKKSSSYIVILIISAVITLTLFPQRYLEISNNILNSISSSSFIQNGLQLTNGCLTTLFIYGIFCWLLSRVFYSTVTEVIDT